MKKSHLRDEVLHCARDPKYFINKYVKIQHPKRGLIKFETYPYQDQTLDCFLKKRKNIVLKARQMGFTELTSSFICWLMIFHPDQKVLTMSIGEEEAKEFIRRIKVAIESIPPWLLIADVVVDNKTSIQLSNRSMIRSIATTKTSGRSSALSLLVIDEAAHIDNMDVIWTGIKPTVSEGGRIIMLSTPNGIGNTFHSIYTGAESGENDFNHMVVPWWEHPEHAIGLRIDEKTGKYTSPWYEKETSDLSEREKEQEYGCGFLSSGHTFFSGECLEYVRSTETKSYAFGDGLQIYSPPQEGRRYIMSIDPASGQGRDSSGIEVFDVETMEQVAEFQGNLKPDGTATMAISIGRQYNNAMMVPEANSVGLSVIEHIKLENYPNLFYSFRGAGPGDLIGEFGSATDGTFPGDDHVPGIVTSVGNRLFMLNKLEEFVRNKKIIIRSQRARAEFETFVWVGKKPQARYGNKDDLVMSLAILVWVRDNIFGGMNIRSNLIANMIAATKTSRTLNTQIVGASKNPDHIPARMMGTFSTQQGQYSIRLPNGKNFDVAKEFGMYIPRKG